MSRLTTEETAKILKSHGWNYIGSFYTHVERPAECFRIDNTGGLMWYVGPHLTATHVRPMHGDQVRRFIGVGHTRVGPEGPIDFITCHGEIADGKCANCEWPLR